MKKSLKRTENKKKIKIRIVTLPNFIGAFHAKCITDLAKNLHRYLFYSKYEDLP